MTRMRAMKMAMVTIETTMMAMKQWKQQKGWMHY